MAMRSFGVAAILLTLTCGAAAAQAPETPSAPAAAPVPTCTTTTTVVKRGDVVLSTTSSTKCEDEGASGGAGAAARAVFGAPASGLATLGKVMALGGVRATASNVRGDWHVLDPSADRVCHLFLTSQPAAAGFRVRRTACAGEFERAEAWTFDDGGVQIHAKGGDPVFRVTGSREHLEGAANDGKLVVLER